jgi:ligand-binding sensor domain-containing protein
MPRSKQIIYKQRGLLADLLAMFAVVIWFTSCEKAPTSSVPKGPKWVVYQAGSGSIANNIVNCVFTDEENNVWFGTNNGASSFKQNLWTTRYDSLSGNAVTCITEEKDGSLWFGLAGGGVLRFNKLSPTQAWIRYTEPALPSNTVISIGAEQQELGEVWAGTDFGIGRFVPTDNPTNINQGVWTTHTEQNDSLHVPVNFVGAIALNPIDNSIWLGVGSLQVESYDIDDNRWGVIYPLPPQVQATITSIAFDNTDHAWVGTYVGVGVLNVNTSVWEHYYTAQDPATKGDFPNSPVNCVTTDLVSNRWFGTNSGLVELNGTTWTLYTQENSMLPSNVVRGVGYDRNGNLWIATSNGVAAYNPLGTFF